MYLQTKTVCLCNLDIFLDNKTDWGYVSDLGRQNVVLCLSRHEYDGNGGATRDAKLVNSLEYANCQDAWIFKSPVWVTLNNCDFEIGRLGCDNAIADRFKKADYRLLNHSGQFKVYHYDICRGKNGSNFLKKTKDEDKERNLTQTYPEEHGQYLLPDLNLLPKTQNGTVSLDEIAAKLKMDTFSKYEIACEMYSKMVRINNRKD